METVTATQPSSALLSFAVARFETACKTVCATRYVSASDVLLRTNVWRGNHGFVGNFDTGLPQATFCSALMFGEATTVSSVTSTPGYRKKCIGRCVNSPLKSATKNIELWRYCGIIGYYNLPLANGGNRKVNGGFEHG